MGQLTTEQAEAIELGLAKLESSGLSPDDMTHLGMSIATGFATAGMAKGFEERPCLRIPYFHPITGAPSTPRPNWPDFFRIRYLKDPPKGFTDDKPRRYAQPAGSGVCAYFPRHPSVNWPDVLGDTSQAIIITEGELKAAKACKESYPTIGLGGVYNFRSTALDTAFLPELEEIDWVQRKVFIVFDSDIRSNPNVCMALQELAEALCARGADPQLVVLPADIPGLDKVGLDDYLVHHPAPTFGALTRDAAQSLTLARTLFDLNDKVSLVRSSVLVVDNQTGNKYSVDNFVKIYGNVMHSERVFGKDGSVSLRKANGAKSWMEWPLRHDVDRLTYYPGRERFFDDPKDGRVYNTWRGWGLQPKPGEYQPFLDLIDHLCTGAEPAAKRWLIQWLACPLQRPGVKMFSSVVVHGRVHGSGKSLLGYTMGRIYGENFTEIKQADLHKDFNSWAEGRQFVLGDDVSGSDKRGDADMLKKLITQRELRVNIKFLPEYVIRDCINFYWTSNQPDAFFLEDEDRRFFILEVIARALAEEFYMDYDIWLDSGGAEAVFAYLLTVDLSDFNPNAPAFRTQAKVRMTEDSRSDLGSWVRSLIEDPDTVLKTGHLPLNSDLFTLPQLLSLYDPENKGRVTANGIGRELRRAGVPQARQGMPVRTEHGVQRFFALRNGERWANATPEEINDHLSNLVKKKRGKFYMR